jgi:oligopeptidase A
MKQYFPSFKVEPQTFIQDTIKLLGELNESFENLINLNNPQWADLESHQSLELNLDHFLFDLNHLKGVNESDEFNKLDEELIPILNRFTSKWNQDQRLYDFYIKIKETNLTSTQSYLIENIIKSFEKSGLNLPDDEKDLLNIINTDLSLLSNDFNKNVQKSSDAFELLIEHKDELKGIPIEDIERFEHNAKAANKNGYLITLQAPDYISVLKFAESPSLRRTIFSAYNSIATTGETNNSPIINKILNLRKEKANLLGFKSYAELSMSNKMAQNPENVLSLLNELKDKAFVKSIHEKDRIHNFAKELDLNEVNHWDYMYLGNKLTEKDYNFDSNEMKQYLPLKNCLNGLYWLIKELFDVDIQEVAAPFSYDQDLTLLKLSKDDKTISYIYMDLFSRKGKRSGAWMQNVVDKTKTQLPIAIVVCNFSKPTKETPALLTFSDFETLFHEFGHALHHTLTEIDVPYACGVNNVPWDAIEVPSTLMEFFCLNESVLNKVAYHYKDNKPLPETLKNNLFKSKNFLFARQLMRQLEFSFIDINLHGEKLIDNPNEFFNQQRHEFGYERMDNDFKSLNTFRHIFAGGYAAGYYSYKWSDIISSDIFQSFNQKDSLCKETAQKYLKEYLSKGGSKQPSELFFNFKGRKPNSDAFLALNGIT